jgi:DNA-binding response OmpR family regulator
MSLSAGHLLLADCSILLVENEPVLAQSIADCLQDAGALVLTARNSNDALRIAEDRRLSSAVLDLDLGGEDSTAVCRRLTERAIPFLFYSGYDHAFVCDIWPNATVVPKPAGEQILITALLALIRR